MTFTALKRARAHTHNDSQSSSAYIMQCMEGGGGRGGGRGGGGVKEANSGGDVLHHSNEPITTFLHPIKPLAPPSPPF